MRKNRSHTRRRFLVFALIFCLVLGQAGFGTYAQSDSAEVPAGMEEQNTETQETEDTQEPSEAQEGTETEQPENTGEVQSPEESENQGEEAAPGDPVNPGEEETPEETVTPQEPTNPGEVTEPEKPENPEETTDTEKPENQEEAVNPGMAEEPGEENVPEEIPEETLPIEEEIPEEDLLEDELLEEEEILEPEEFLSFNFLMPEAAQQIWHSSSAYDREKVNNTPADENYEESGLILKKFVTDRGDGTFDLTLGVKSISQIETSSSRADIILVLDRSGSMAGKMSVNGSETTRMAYLKSSAKQFVQNIKDAGFDARIDVVSFASDYTDKEGRHSDEVTNETGGFLTVADEAGEIKSAIDDLTAFGGTYTDAGLEEAMNVLANTDSTGRSRYVILFTDGEPTGNNTAGHGGYVPWNNAVVTASKNNANTLKSTYGCTVFTIGMFSSSGDSVDQYMEALSSENSSGEEYYYRVSDELGLEEIFEEIRKEIGTTLAGAKVRDYLTDEFRLTAESRSVLEAQGALVGTDENGTYIQWTRDIVPGEDFSMFTGITVTAADETVCGEVLPTNRDQISALYRADESECWEFPKPTVSIERQYTLELQITKTIDACYSALTKPNHNQSFVFRIDRYENEADEAPAETFYEVLSFANSESEKTKTAVIKNLPEGFYTVSEAEDWSWKYVENKSARRDNYAGNGSAEGTMLPLGERLESGTVYGISGVSQEYGEPAKVWFTNTLDTSVTVPGDPASAVNEFTGS